MIREEIMKTEIKRFCKYCKSYNMKKISTENVSEHLDNIIHIFECQVCKNKQSETVHIG